MGLGTRLLCGFAPVGLLTAAQAQTPLPPEETTGQYIELSKLTAEVDEDDTDSLQTQASGGALGERSVLDTPFSIVVIDSGKLNEQQVSSLQELFSNDASVTVNTGAYDSFGANISVRGLPLDYTNSFKINGMSLNNFSGELPYEVFERVELLKGATGFMYGFAVPGGVVNYVTKKPVDALFSAAAGYRSDSIFSANLDASTRTGSDHQYGLRLNLAKETGDTYLDRGAVDRTTASLAFDAQLTDALHGTVDLIYNDRKTENSATTLSNSLASSDSLPEPVDGSRNIGVNGTFDDHKNLIALTSLNWDIDDNWSMRLDYSNARNDTRWVKNQAYLLNSDGDVSITLYDQYFDVNINQLQATVTGKLSTGGIDHQLTAGASHQKAATYRNDPNRRVTRGYGIDNLYQPVALPTYNSTLTEDLSRAWTDKQQSVFASDTLSIATQWQALLGLRFNDFDHLPGEYFASYHDHYEDSTISPTAAILFKPEQNATYYVSYVESFEGSTSAVGESYANANELLPPLKSKQYELGVKLDGAAWALTSALFRIERGAQIVTDENYLVQDGLTLYQGIEFGGVLQINDNWRLNGDLMLLNAEYDKTNAITEGNDVTGAPEQQASIHVQYSLNAIHGLQVSAGAKYYGKTAVDANNVWRSPAYTLLDAGVSYAMPMSDHHLTVIGTMNNLADKNYWTVTDIGSLRIGSPRTIALKVQYDW